MYWIVLVIGLAAMRSHSPAVSQSLGLAGALLVIPLAVGLYFALRPGQNKLAGTALGSATWLYISGRRPTGRGAPKTSRRHRAHSNARANLTGNDESWSKRNSRPTQDRIKAESLTAKLRQLFGKVADAWTGETFGMFRYRKGRVVEEA